MVLFIILQGTIKLKNFKEHFDPYSQVFIIIEITRLTWIPSPSPFTFHSNTMDNLQ